MEIGFEEWTRIEQEQLTIFYMWWLEQNETDPEMFPLEMDAGEWDEQYRAWQSSPSRHTAKERGLGSYAAYQAGIAEQQGKALADAREEIVRLFAQNAKMREALEYVQTQLYIDDYGDYCLLTTFGPDVVEEALKEAE